MTLSVVTILRGFSRLSPLKSMETNKSQDIFEGFDPPKTTDGSYKGIMKKVKATEEFLESKFQEEFKSTNSRLKAARVRVSLKLSGKTIQLQATLPDKPEGSKGKPWQQIISLGIPANLDGLKTAEEEAYELGKLIARHTFEWNDKYLGNGVIRKECKTIGELLEEFEAEYFKIRPFSEKTQKTIRKYRIARIKRYCSLDALPTEENFKKFILAVSLDGAKEGLIIAIKLFCSVFKINIDLTSVKPCIKRNLRNIPSDELIEDCFHLFKHQSENRKKEPKAELRDTWKLKSWLYGMLSSYGLRPHELLTKPNINWWLSPQNIDNTWEVHEDTKTGSRKVFPLNARWIEIFDLKNPERLAELKILTLKFTSLSSCDFAVQNLAQYFKRINIPFKPYDLRHAWAIRAHLMGIPIKAAADNLGHSVEMHTMTYQRWFSEDNRKQAINQAIAKKSQLDELREENEQLKLKLQQLKLELQRQNFMGAVVTIHEF
jgi:integrase